ncbi:MAG: hypothetical protein HOU81_14875 [Hamadaea sp.]|uniref:hypothetical protein n=1 Tax=Hamadaea sp. TaxID=2024425 RepID=UPI001826D332|nr:hypothetical protein [Hamadaea sp.]NUR72096.1 hypothetical protein [Hamadaea sp.]NUT22818.1 hypothetical protein [Hamadaea sp.]
MPRWVKICTLLVIVWAAAFAFVALQLAWLLIPFVWLGVAGLVRVGERLLDRLVAGAFVTAGCTMAAGLGFSVWPWGLDPAPVAGVALTAIVLTAVLSGRRIRLPRPSLHDAAPVGAALVITILVAMPYLRAADFTGVLAAMMGGEDSSRHASLVDHIRVAGAYTFIHPRTTSDVLNPGMADYPQGWHLVTAILENLLAATTHLGSDEKGVVLLVIMMLATFFALMLVVTWGAGRVAGPKLGLGAYCLVVMVAGWLAAWSELVRTIVYTYPAEMAGLAFLGGLVVAVTRPAVKVRDQITLVAALTIGVGFSYYLFLPIAVVIALGGMIMDRRRMRRVPISVAAGVLVAGLAATQAAAAVLLGGRESQLALGVLGDVRPIEIGVLALLIIAGVILGRRRPGWRRYSIPLATALAATGMIYLYQRLSGSQPGYYFGKMLHVTVLVLILGVAAIGAVAGPVSRRLSGRFGVRATVAVAVLAVAAAGQVIVGAPSLTGVPWLTQQASGKTAQPASAQTVMQIYRACPIDPHRPTVLFYSAPGLRYGYGESVFLTALQRQAGAGYAATYSLPSISAEKRAEAIVRRVRKPVRIVVGDRQAEAILTEALRAQPERAAQIELVDLASLTSTGRCDPITPRPTDAAP